MKKSLRTKLLTICSQSELGRRMGKTQQTISHWFSKQVPAAEIINTVRALDWKITPHELRPDLYPNPTDGMPPEQSTAAAE